jgi:hypothetical protein
MIVSSIYVCRSLTSVRMSRTEETQEINDTKIVSVAVLAACASKVGKGERVL